MTKAYDARFFGSAAWQWLSWRLWSEASHAAAVAVAVRAALSEGRGWRSHLPGGAGGGGGLPTGLTPWTSPRVATQAMAKERGAAGLSWPRISRTITSETWFS